MHTCWVSDLSALEPTTALPSRNALTPSTPTTMCVPQFVSDWGPAHNREENRKSIAHTRSVLTYGSWHVAHSSTHTTYKCDDAVRDWLVVRLGDDLEANTGVAQRRDEFLHRLRH